MTQWLRVATALSSDDLRPIFPPPGEDDISGSDGRCTRQEDQEEWLTERKSPRDKIEEHHWDLAILRKTAHNLAEYMLRAFSANQNETSIFLEQLACVYPDRDWGLTALQYDISRAGSGHAPTKMHTGSIIPSYGIRSESASKAWKPALHSSSPVSTKRPSLLDILQELDHTTWP
ncbi:hypothetical protein FALBO_10701 [Fusarium albosuccineum]|uniref:Uncharacterized protein n=1 Tax=Fusarium albosuccineum TaxID=1237068 RepID=A0A8H4L3N7_9HYPO|nr:hypothetical protein FALBO_10701 [Fusarium albosuccineum]